MTLLPLNNNKLDKTSPKIASTMTYTIGPVGFAETNSILKVFLVFFEP